MDTTLDLIIADLAVRAGYKASDIDVSDLSKVFVEGYIVKGPQIEHVEWRKI